jgi:hypothetical protein
MHVEGAASLKDVVLVDASGGRRTIPNAEALSITATIHDRDATIHATLVGDGLTRGGRIAEATIVSGSFSAWLFEESSVEVEGHDDDDDADVGAVGGWAAAAAASASSAKQAIVEDAELTWAQAAAVSEAARAVPARHAPSKLGRPTRPRVESSVPLPRVDPIPTSRDRAVEPEYLEEPVLERGDHVSHKQFGLCKIERVDDDGALRVKLLSGQRKEIKLDPFTVQGPRLDGAGRRVFDLVPRRK